MPPRRSSAATTSADGASMTVVALRRALSAAGLPTTGLKAELVDRYNSISSSRQPYQQTDVRQFRETGKPQQQQQQQQQPKKAAAASAPASAFATKPKPKPKATNASKAAAPKAAAAAKRKSTKKGPSETLGLVPGRILRNTQPGCDHKYAHLGKGFPVYAWKLDKMLGSGAEGDVWRAHAVAGPSGELATNPALTVALKVAASSSRLFYEQHIMSRFDCQTWEAQEAGLPLLCAHGIDMDASGNKDMDVKFLALELLGKTLRQTFEEDCNGEFSDTTIRLCLANMVRALRFIHRKGHIYRDLSPANMMVGAAGTDNYNRLYLIDLGIAEAINGLGNKAFSGTPAFASMNAMRTSTPTGPADDLLALGHVLAWCDLGGDLPWLSANIDGGAARPANKPATQKELAEAADKRERTYYAGMLKSLRCAHLRRYIEKVRPLTDPTHFTPQLADSVYDSILDDLLEGLPANAKYDWASSSQGSHAARSPRMAKGQAGSASAAASSPAAKKSKSAVGSASSKAAQAKKPTLSKSQRGSAPSPSARRALSATTPQSKSTVARKRTSAETPASASREAKRSRKQEVETSDGDYDMDDGHADFSDQDEKEGEEEQEWRCAIM